MWKYKFHVPETKQVRLLVYTDCANEADDQYAVAHVLMTQKFDVVGIIAAHFDMNTRREGAPYAPGTTAQASYDEILTVLDKMGVSGQYPIALGSGVPLEDEKTPILSDGAKIDHRGSHERRSAPIIHRLSGFHHDPCFRNPCKTGNL